MYAPSRFRFPTLQNKIWLSNVSMPLMIWQISITLALSLLCSKVKCLSLCSLSLVLQYSLPVPATCVNFLYIVSRLINLPWIPWPLNYFDGTSRWDLVQCLTEVLVDNPNYPISNFEFFSQFTLNNCQITSAL